MSHTACCVRASAGRHMASRQVAGSNAPGRQNRRQAYSSASGRYIAAWELCEKAAGGQTGGCMQVLA